MQQLVSVAMLLLVLILLTCQAKSHEHNALAKKKHALKEQNAAPNSQSENNVLATKDHPQSESPRFVYPSDKSAESQLAMSHTYEEHLEEKSNVLGTTSTEPRTHGLEDEIDGTFNTEGHQGRLENKDDGKSHSVHTSQTPEQTEDKDRKGTDKENVSQQIRNYDAAHVLVTGGDSVIKEGRKVPVSRKLNYTNRQQHQPEEENQASIASVLLSNNTETWNQSSKIVSNRKTANFRNAEREMYRQIVNTGHFNGSTERFKEVEKDATIETASTLKKFTNPVGMLVMTLSLGFGEMKTQENVSAQYSAPRKKARQKTLTLDSQEHQVNRPPGVLFLSDISRTVPVVVGDRHVRCVSRTPRQATGGTNNYTEDGVERTPVTAGRCRCRKCNTTSAAYVRGPFENVAYNKPAVASSYLRMDLPCSATDGMQNTTHRTTYHSGGSDSVPWLQIDLEHVITFAEFFVFRRHIVEYNGAKDKLRMLGLDILTDGRLCYSFPRYTQGFSAVANLPRAIPIRCPSTTVTARYIRLQKRDEHIILGRYSNMFLIINNVEIWVCKPGFYGEYGKLCRPCPQRCDFACNNHYGCALVTHNVAILKNASQSITGIGSPSNVVDGIRAVSDILATCTQMSVTSRTYMSEKVWWRVDLAAIFKIYSVAITGRTDCCELPLGSDCTASNQFIGCGGDAECYHNKCKSRLLGRCTDNDDCMHNAVCDLNKCKLDVLQDCNPRENKCKSRTFCETTTRKCKIKIGRKCKHHDAWCQGNAICDILYRCGLKVRESCAASSECVSGATCKQNRCTCKAAISVTEDDQCRPVQGRIGSSCLNDDGCSIGQCINRTCNCEGNQAPYFEDFSCRKKAGSACDSTNKCNTGLVCEGGACRLLVGKNCYGNRENCQDGTTCDSDVCKFEVGQNCTNNEELCIPGTTCSSGICKYMLNINCKSSPRHCEVGVCSAADGDTCRIGAGQPCTGLTGQFCVSGSLCENEVCKLDFRTACTNSKLCRTGLRCTTGTGSTDKKCRRLMGTSGCNTDGDCEANTVCDNHKHCRIPKGGNCEDHPDMCIHGSQCSDATCQCNAAVTNDQTDKCDVKAQKVGGTCTASSDPSVRPCDDQSAYCASEGICKCNNSFVADPTSLECRVALGSSCKQLTPNESLPDCAVGTECGVVGVCAIKAGESCIGDRRGHCTMGTLCDEDNICRLTIHRNCENDTTSCRLGTTCDFLKRCNRIPGEGCREDRECMAGSHCSQHGVCGCTAGITTQSGDKCVPGQGIVGGICKDGHICSDPFAVCSETSECECSDGYSTDPVTLICARGMGQNCKDAVDCITGLICDPDVKTCHIPVGQMCDGGNEKNCAAGLVCDIQSMCRLDLKGNCSGINGGFCKSGTFCDLLGECHLGVGELCDNETEEGCVAGAICFEDVCVCDPTTSSAMGAICGSHKGKYGSMCDLICDGDNTECVDGVCECGATFKPDRRFNCVSRMGLVPHHYATLWIGMFWGLFLLLLLIVIALLVWHRRKKHDERMDLQMKGQQAIQSLVSLREELESIVEAEQEQLTADEDTDQDAVKSSSSSSAAIRPSMGSGSSVGVPSVMDTFQSVVETSKFERTE